MLAPAVPATISNIALNLITAAQDTNTNALATVLNSNRDLPVRTVERALLSVAIQSDSVFSAGQTNIPVTVNLSNAGVAAMSDGS